MLSFRHTVMTTILLATVVPSGLIAAFLLKDLYDTTSRSAIRELDLRAGEAAAVIEQHLSRTTLGLDALAATSDLAFGASSILFETEATELLQLYMADHNMVTQIAILAPSGRLIFKVHQPNAPDLLNEAVAKARERLSGQPTMLVASAAKGTFITYRTPLLLHKSNQRKTYELAGYAVAVIAPEQITRKLDRAHIDLVGLRVMLEDHPLIARPWSGLSDSSAIKSVTKTIAVPGGQALQVTLSSPAELVFAQVYKELWTTLWSVGLLVLAMAFLAWTVSRRLALSLVAIEECIESYHDGSLAWDRVKMRFSEFQRLNSLLSDMTKKMEDYRQRSVLLSRQAAVGELMQMLAHDIRKPFSLMRMGLAILRTAKSQDDLNDVLPKVTMRVEQSLQSVNAMLADALTITDESRLQQEERSLRALIDLCLGDLLPALQDRNITFIYQIDGDPQLYIDEQKIRRVITNIIDNAIHACEHQGSIWFYAHPSRQTDCIDLTIGNNGKCIPEPIRARIFDSFFTHGKKDGTGLGLAIAKTFVDMHGGTISCRSSPELGTEFILTLPGQARRVA